MGVVVRVSYNNRNWETSCKYPGKDSLCFICYEDKLRIERPGENDEVCKGSCWEQDLCVNYEWGCTPEYKQFNSRKAYKGARVFFTFRQPDGNYTLWGQTTIQAVNVKPIRKSNPNEGHYEYFLRFAPFKPLDKDKWVKNMTDRELVEAKWRQGRFRYITAEREAILERLIEGSVPEKPGAINPAILPSDIILNIAVTNTMHTRLRSAANEDGRQIDEIVREAIAEWLRRRQA